MSILKHIILINLVLAIPVLLNLENSSSFSDAAFVIEEGSELKLSGSSNVNKFSCLCDCYDSNELYSFKMKSSEEGDEIKFKSNVLKLRADGLDCGHRGMNKDMYEMLKVEEYPHITIELISALLPNKNSLKRHNEWVSVNAETALTISGVCQQFEMNVRAQKLSDQHYRFIGTKQLYMDDFQLDPPSPMLGLIKVDNEFQIQLDLVVRMEKDDG